MDYLREGDVLAVWKLDWLGRSLKDLIAKVEALGERGREFKSLQGGIDTTTSAGKLTFTSSVRWRSSSATSFTSARWRACALPVRVDASAGGHAR